MKVSTGIANRLLDYVDGDSVKNMVQPDVDLNEDKFTKTMYNNGLSYYNGLFDGTSEQPVDEEVREQRGAFLISESPLEDKNEKMDNRKEKDYFMEYKLYFMSIPLLLGLVAVLLAYRSVVK